MAHGLAISRLAEVDALSNAENASVPQSLALLRPPGQWRQSTCHTTRCAVVGPIGHYRQHAATVPLGATQNRNKCPFIYVSMRVRVHMRLFTRAVELDRARAGTAGTVENAFSVVWFLRVGTVHQYICYKLPNAHGVHANLAHVRGSQSLQSQSLS